ncbi:glycoside hydrolase family 65 protein [Cohnella sp. GCM10027633]|uniref:glycoside hydrolase family 65 protein n=1 Tax=unclassified Cohnella TaxID=2636738 RepID=UPI00363BD11D
MAKVADKYLKVNPWAVIEEGFDPARNRVSESIFSLGNEYMGVRGYPDEGYSGDSLVGSYFNGLYEEMKLGAHYKGIIRSLRFMANAVNWLHTRIEADGETLDLAKSDFSNYVRRVDFRTGVYERQFVWHLAGGKSIRVTFERLVSMTHSNLGGQRVTFESDDFEGDIRVQAGLDFSPIHEDQGKNLWNAVSSGEENGWTGIVAKTINTGNRLVSAFALETSNGVDTKLVLEDKYVGQAFSLPLKPGQLAHFGKLVVNFAEKDASVDMPALKENVLSIIRSLPIKTFNEFIADQTAYWTRIWDTSDIAIEGDPDNQQGIRFCIFQLYQTYRGDNPGFNIGAKGLTGEAYRGLAFWDTETYCLPFYLFNNPKAARSLLEFRYRSLPNALERAKEVDCKGAFYPIATIDGTESCDLWQHSNLQLQVGTAVGYGIWHYVKVTGDKSFLHEQGMEMLMQLCRFYESRGQWGQQSGKFGYFGVMGPDEFQLMVNNNCYLNLMAKNLFEYTLQAIADMQEEAPEAFDALAERLGVTGAEWSGWKRLADDMKIPLNEETGVYEQHDGFFDMPHIDIHAIPVTDFPLYHNWSYDRIYRYDMIKQPDVLMFMFLYNQQFSHDSKLANYEYYESRCIHESSLSPSIHSIFAAELGKHEEAYRFFEFATRLDLDNYNRNTREGLHTTSIAASWMNIVYGFGGLRSDGPGGLILNPTIPSQWSGYSFKFLYQGTVLSVKTTQSEVEVKAVSGGPVRIRLYGGDYEIDAEGVKIELEAVRVG